MKGERNTENINRTTLLDFIVQNPSVSFQNLAKIFDMNESTLRYHIDYLLRNGEITIRRSGVSKIFYPKLIRNHYNGFENGKKVLTRSELRVLTIISNEPGITRTGIKNSVSMRSKDITYVITKLKERNLIWENSERSEKTYEIVTREKILSNAMVLLIKMFLDKEIDEPTFLELKKEVERQIQEEKF
jgi:predicted transcriptional regulator